MTGENPGISLDVPGFCDYLPACKIEKQRESEMDKVLFGIGIVLFVANAIVFAPLWGPFWVCSKIKNRNKPKNETNNNGCVKLFRSFTNM